MAMSHEEATKQFASDIAALVDRTPAYYGLPREMFSIVCADSNLRVDINERVRQEIDAVENGYTDIMLSDREDMHKRDMGQITYEEYDELDRERGIVAEEVTQRGMELRTVTEVQLEQKLPGVLEEDVLLSLYPQLADDDLQSEQMADTEQRIRNSLYNSDIYFNLADGAERLERSFRELHKCERDYETALPENLDDAYYALSDAQSDMHAIAHDMAFSWYAVDAYEQHVSGQEVTPFSFEAIADKENEIVHMYEEGGFNAVMEHIDKHVFYEMSLKEQLDVVSQRFERNEAINANLVDYCVNKSMGDFARMQDVAGCDYDFNKSRELFRADIEAAKDFKSKYPTSNVVTEKMLGAMEMAYTTDGRSVGYDSSQPREGVNHELVSSDGFPDFSVEDEAGEYPNS